MRLRFPSKTCEEWIKVDGTPCMFLGSDQEVNILTIYVVKVCSYISTDDKYVLKRKVRRVLWFFHSEGQVTRSRLK